MILRRIQISVAEPWQRTLYIMFLAQLMVGVGFSSMNPFLPPFVKELGSAYGLSIDMLAGMVYSLQAFTMMLTAPIWGSIADRYGRKLMVERSMFGGALILIAMPFARSAEDLVLMRAIQGMLTGTVAATNALVASMTPREHAGYAMGFIAVGMGAGVAFGPMIGGAVADAFGYRVVFYVTAALLFLAGLVVAYGVKEPGHSGPALNMRVWMAAVTAARPWARKEQSAPVKVKKLGILAGWRKILACPGVPAAYLLSFLNQLSRNLLTPVVPLFIPMLMPGASHVNTFTGLVLGIASATTTLSGVYLGRLGDRLGQRRILIVSLVISSVLYAVQTFVSDGWQLLILQAVVGVALGGISPSISALLARFSQPGMEGAVYGLDNSLGAGARSLAPIAGSAAMVLWGIRSPFLVTGVMLAATAVVTMAALPKQGNCEDNE